MLSLAKPHHYYQVVLSQGLGMGTGVGLIYLPTSAVVSQHFKHGKAFAMGLVGSGGSLGAVVFRSTMPAIDVQEKISPSNAASPTSFGTGGSQWQVPTA